MGRFNLFLGTVPVAEYEAVWLGKCLSYGRGEGYSLGLTPAAAVSAADSLCLGQGLLIGQGLLSGLFAPGLERVSWRRLLWTSSLECVICLSYFKSLNVFLISYIIPSLKQIAAFWKW